MGVTDRIKRALMKKYGRKGKGYRASAMNKNQAKLLNKMEREKKGY